MNQNEIPSTPDALIGRESAAQALTASGYVTSPQTLATKASRGNGPPYRIFGSRAIYRWGDVLRWAEEKAGPFRASTSDIGAIGKIGCASK